MKTVQEKKSLWHDVCEEIYNSKCEEANLSKLVFIYVLTLKHQLYSGSSARPKQ